MLVHAHIAFMLFHANVILSVGVIAQSKMGILKDCNLHFLLSRA